jgi:hypothetical protein
VYSFAENYSKMNSLKTLLVVALFIASVASCAARDAARDLKRMKGYFILDAAAVETISDKGATAILRLDNGQTFEVPLLIAPVLELTDVIVFAKPPSKDLIAKYPSLPVAQLYTYKLLIENEAYDATLRRK